MADYYKTLGVGKNATQDEIKSAYRKLVKQYHPDLHPGDAAAAAKFKEINEANEVLSDPQKRKQYDFEQEHPGMGSGGGFGGFGGFGGGGGFGGFGDIFNDIFGGGFGGGSASPQETRGEDITVNVTLSFLDAAKGCTREVTYTRNEPCPSCKGTGAKGGTAFKTCEKCGGSGQVQYVNNGGIFRTVSVRPCSECGGTGRKVIETCPDCKGKGYNRKSTTVNIEVPAGADNGSYMKKRGYGQASATGGPPGDLLIVFSVAQHKLFRRKNFDLYAEVPISYRTAVLGGKIGVPLLDEVMEYTVPEGTQSGKVFCVRGKGIRTRSGTGDLYLTVTVEVPVKMTRDQKYMLEDFNSTLENKQYAKIKQYQENVEALYGENPYKKDK